MPTKVAVIGGTGLLGKHLTHGFLDNGSYDVSVVTRKGGDPAKLAPLTSKGAKVIEVDFADQDGLIAGLKGQEIVVSAAGNATLADQPKYIEAAKAAGVRRFVPSEFGLDTSAPGIREYFPMLGHKYATRDAVEKSGLEWTYVISGFFTETVFTPAFFFDVPNGRATVKANPDAPFTITSLTDVGRWTAEALLDPVSKNSTVYLRGANVTYREAIKTIEEATGRKLDVTYVSADQLETDIADSSSDLTQLFSNLLVKAINDGWGESPSAKTPGAKPFRGPEAATVTLADYAKRGKWQWSDA